MKKKVNKKKETEGNKKTEDIIKETAEAFFDSLGIGKDFSLNFQEGEEKEVEISLNTEEGGIVIGYHGEVLEALQLVLSLILTKKLGGFVRVSLEVGGYKKNRTEFLNTLALQTKERVLAQNSEIPLLDLKSWERRIIHLILQNDKEVTSESVGEGKDRTLVVKPKI
ncbi:MAG: KH domain-containing protein [bacterium]|nr:KH domain-containing protein [bacterium]